MPRLSPRSVKKLPSASFPDFAQSQHRSGLRASLWCVSSALLAQALLIDFPAIAQTGSQGMCPPGYFQIEGPGWTNCAPIPGGAAPPATTPPRRPRRQPAPAPSQKAPVPENNWYADIQGVGGIGKGSCQPGSARCWYAFWGSGGTPYRKLFFADVMTRQPTSDKNIVEMDIVTAFETHNPHERVSHDHVLLTFQFQCKKKQLRLVDGYALLWNGTTNRVPEASPWSPFQATWMEVASRIACDSNVRLRPQDNRLVWFGDMERPADVVTTTRRVLWNQAAKAR